MGQWLTENDRMTIQIPKDLARSLEGIAAEQHSSPQQVALDGLRSLVDKSSSPRAVLRRVHALPHPSSLAVNELEDSIAAERLPVTDPPSPDS